MTAVLVGTLIVAALVFGFYRMAKRADRGRRRDGQAGDTSSGFVPDGGGSGSETGSGGQAHGGGGSFGGGGASGGWDDAGGGGDGGGGDGGGGGD